MYWDKNVPQTANVWFLCILLQFISTLTMLSINESSPFSQWPATLQDANWELVKMEKPPGAACRSRTPGEVPPLRSLFDPDLVPFSAGTVKYFRFFLAGRQHFCN